MSALTLTAEQAMEITRHIRPGFTILGRIEPEPFSAALGNGATSGRLRLVFTEIPADRLDNVRKAIAGEAPKPKRRKS